MIGGNRALERMLRMGMQKKQERSQTIEEGAPRVGDLVEAVPEFRYIKNKGVVQYVRYKNIMYSLVLKDESKTKDDATKSEGVGRLEASKGYTEFPNGIVLQWGETTGASNTETIMFGTVFPNACFQVISEAGKNPGGGTANTNTYNIQKDRFDIYHGS